MKTLKNKKGFTLMEMLIVIAIMVVLMAIAIPTLSNQLEGARKTADDANLRSAKSVAMLSAIANDGEVEAGEVYDIASGEFVEDSTGKTDANKAKSKAYENQYITVISIDTNGAVVEWDD